MSIDQFSCVLCNAVDSMTVSLATSSTSLVLVEEGRSAGVGIGAGIGGVVGRVAVLVVY